MVSPAGIEPAPFRNGFSYHYNFRCRSSSVCSLDYTLTIAEALGPARLVSTPSSFRGLVRDCHVKGFPEFEQFYSKSFLKGTQFPIKVRRVYQFRHGDT